jgi:RNA polymerase-binding transcription factor DksA
MDGTLLETVEGMGHSPFVSGSGEIWQRLQGEKEELSQELFVEGSLLYDEGPGWRQSDPSGETLCKIEGRCREQLEARLRDLNDAQDRLIDGRYGRCAECGNEIDCRRLMGDRAASLCLACQTIADGEPRFREL